VATAACWTAIGAASTTGARAARSAGSRALTDPPHRSTPNRSVRHGAASRLLSRARPLSRATTAVSRAPNPSDPRPAGTVARVSWPQAAQRRAASPDAVTVAATDGRATSWRRSAAGSRAPATAARAAPHPCHRAGKQAPLWSALSDGRSRRKRPGCPGCPPGWRAAGVGCGGRRPGGSGDGGRDAFVPLCPRQAGRSATGAVSAATGARRIVRCCSCAAMVATNGSRSAPARFMRRRLASRPLPSTPAATRRRAHQGAERLQKHEGVDLTDIPERETVERLIREANVPLELLMAH